MRRCPLFLRLIKPFPHLTAEPVVYLTTDDEDDFESSEVDIYLVSRNCRRMQAWARQLKARHKLDETHKTEEGISSLSLEPMNQHSLRGIGKWSQNVYGDHGMPLKTIRGDQTVHARARFVCAAVARATDEAVGFVAFDVAWHVDSYGDYRELEVEPDQVWMDPAYRLQRRGELLAWGVSSAVHRHLTEVARTGRWRGPVSPRIVVGADIYSQSGERFLELCADAIDFEITWARDLENLAFKSLAVHARW